MMFVSFVVVKRM